jgi:hypothetical protein
MAVVRTAGAEPATADVAFRDDGAAETVDGAESVSPEVASVSEKEDAAGSAGASGLLTGV